MNIKMKFCSVSNSGLTEFYGWSSPTCFSDLVREIGFVVVVVDSAGD